MGDDIKTKSSGDTNFAKDRGIAITIKNDIGELLSILKENNAAPEHLDRLREARDKVFELQSVLLDLQEENASLRKENKELKETLEIKAKMKFESPFYYYGEGEQKDGPFCQRCWDVERKQVRPQGYPNDRWKCPECKNWFNGQKYIPGKAPTYSCDLYEL